MQPMGRRFFPWAVALAVLLAAFILVSTIYTLVTRMHPVPYMDGWEMIPLLEAHLRGDLTFSLLWRPWAEHRIFFPKLLYLADFFFSGGTGSFLITSSLVFQGGVAAVIAAAIGRRPGFSVAERTVLVAFTVMVCFWLVQSGDFIWGFEVVWFLNALGVLLAFFWVSGLRGDGGTGDWARVLAAAAVSAVATYSLGNGIVAWPVVLVLLLRTGAPRALIAFWTVAFLVAAAGYFLGDRAPAPPLSPDVLFRMRNVIFLLDYLGNPVTRAGAFPGAMVGLVGFSAFCAFAFRFLRSPSPFRLQRLGVAQGAYVVGTAVLTTLGRAPEGLEKAASSRYYPPVLLFWLFLALLAWSSGRDLPRVRRALVALAWIAGLAIAIGQLVSVPQRDVRYVAADEAAMALRAGVDDPFALHYLEHHPERPAFRRYDSLLRARGLAHYREPWATTRGRALAEIYAVDSEGPRARATLSPPEARGARARTGRYLSGTRSVPRGMRMPDILLITEEGRIVGFAGTAHRACPGCFTGYAWGPGGKDMRLYALDCGRSHMVRGVDVVRLPVSAAP